MLRRATKSQYSQSGLGSGISLPVTTRVRRDSANFQATGLAVDSVFLGRAFQKYGVKADFEQRYEYKNAVNVYTQSDFTAAHREAMVRLAIGAEPRFVIDRCEIERAGPSYTLDTVRELQAAQPAAEFFLIIGADQYAGLHT
jgi:hypothetical protein